MSTYAPKSADGLTRTKHRDQLTQLLLSKFKNRFGVTADEPKIEKLIQAEVTELLKHGTATEQGLMRLEAKIETAINQHREKAQLEAEEKLLKQEIGGGDNKVDPS